MTDGVGIVAFPARTSRDWQAGGAWGRDAHLLRALASCSAEEPRLVVIDRAGVLAAAAPHQIDIDGLQIEVLSQRVQVPGWTRWRLPAAVARHSMQSLPQGIPRLSRGVVVCFDVLRHQLAARVARVWGYQLVTDLMDDWRLHASIPAWHARLRDEIYPSLDSGGALVTAVTRLAASPLPAVLVPNAGYHEGEPVPDPRPGPRRPVAAFVGTIHPRLDASLLVRVARELPRWDIVAVGPVMDRGVAATLAEGGVRLETWWRMEEIDRRATVVVAPYVDSAFTRSGDPLKIYEATARGVPCVSTLGVSAPPSTGLTVAGADEFVEAVNDAALGDRSEIVGAARAVGSWEDRARTILKALGAPWPVVREPAA